MPGPYPLTTLAPQIDRTGIHTLDFVDILASLDASFKQIFGSDSYTAADSQEGQWLAVMAQSFFDLGQSVAAAYYAYSPSFAQGTGLSSQVKINGLQRLVPSQSSADVVLIGQAGTVIPAGAVRDDFGNLWDLEPGLTIPASGELRTRATAREAGQLLAAPHTLTRIATQIAGWQSVTNPDPASPGDPLESDARLRLRQHRSTALPAITPISGIYATLANIVGAGRVEVYENDKDWIDANGIPGHSIAPVLDGGDAHEIATAIALKKSPGCGTYGTTSVDVLDGAAQPNTINFFYTTQVAIQVQVRLTPRTGYVSATAELIRQVVAHFISETRHGWPVYREWLWVPASLAGDAATEVTGFSQFDLHRLAETYVIDDILLGRVGEPMGSADVSLHFAEASYATAENVGVVIR